MSVRTGRWDSSTNTTEILSWDKITTYPSGFTRHYLGIDDNWSGGFTQWSFTHNRIPVFCIHAWHDVNGVRHAVQWSAIANGDWDTQIAAHATDFMALTGRNVPAYMVFHHEPENEENNNVSGDLPSGEHCGTSAEFKAAQKRFRSVVQSIVPFQDMRHGITLMAGTYTGGHGDWPSWTDGCDFNFLGIDGYNHGSTKETFDAIYTPAHEATSSIGKKLFIQESGCEEISTSPNFKANFFAQGQSLMKTWPELIGFQYSNVQAKGNYKINTSTASLNAFKKLVNDPYFTGTWS